jgi:hypothetical protein
MLSAWGARTRTWNLLIRVKTERIRKPLKRLMFLKITIQTIHYLAPHSIKTPWTHSLNFRYFIREHQVGHCIASMRKLSPEDGQYRAPCLENGTYAADVYMLRL